MSMALLPHLFPNSPFLITSSIFSSTPSVWLGLSLYIDNIISKSLGLSCLLTLFPNHLVYLFTDSIISKSHGLSQFTDNIISKSLVYLSLLTTLFQNWFTGTTATRLKAETSLCTHSTNQRNVMFVVNFSGKMSAFFFAFCFLLLHFLLHSQTPTVSRV